jgi:type II secretory pathway pseudopilin PulG
MDFKHTSTRNSPAPFKKATAFTLIEILVAMGIGFVLLAVVGSLSLWSGRSFAAMANYADLDNNSRNALDRLTREIREVKGLSTYTTNATQKELKLVDKDGQFLYYRYNAPAQTLTRVKNGVSEVLLEDCTIMNFSLYQRNTVSNSFNQYQVFTGTNASMTCKVIQMNWICSRRLFPTELLNSESIQTAKIVIRHH